MSNTRKHQKEKTSFRMEIKMKIVAQNFFVETTTTKYPPYPMKLPSMSDHL